MNCRNFLHAGQKEDAAARLLGRSLYRFGRIVQKGCFGNRDDRLQIACTFAFGHQQGQALHQRPFAHAGWADENDMAIFGQRQQAQHIAQQILAVEHWRQLTGFGLPRPNRGW